MNTTMFTVFNEVKAFTSAAGCDNSTSPLRLDANSSATELKEMPLWLAKGLKKQGFVSTWLPKTYSERSMQKMKAGASTVHLGQRYPYFYELGTEVAILDATQAGMEVVKTLEGAFAQRYKGILDRFHNIFFMS